MKKILAIGLVVVLTMSFLTACSGNTNIPSGDDSTSSINSTASGDSVNLTAAANKKFADYIINMAKDMAASNNLLESTVGDTFAHKMTVDEITAKAEEYRAIILENINNEDVVTIREENGIRYYEFYIEKSLNILGVGTHMSAGLPDYLEVVKLDELGYKLTAVFSCNI